MPDTRKVDIRLPGKGNSNSHGARPVHLIITMMKWIRTSRLSSSSPAFRAAAWGMEEGSYLRLTDFVSRNSRLQSNAEEEEVWGTGLSHLKETAPPLEPYLTPMTRVIGGSSGGGRFLMGEVPLYGCWGCLISRLESSKEDEQLLRINVKRFRGGLVFKAHRLLHHSTLGLRVIIIIIKRGRRRLGVGSVGR